MLKYVLRRLLAAIPTLFAIITLAFFLIRLAPGGPFDQERQLSPEIQANINRMYHLDESLPMQYLRYLGNILQGDFGPSFKYQDFTVNQLIAQGFPVSMQLGLMAIAIAFLVGSLIGTYAAMRQNSYVDNFLMAGAMVGITIPNFVMANVLILFLTNETYWKILPASVNVDSWTAWLLPLFCLTLPQVAYLARLMRGSMIEALNANHVRTARAKGVPEWQVVLRHCLKPALMPVISVLGPTMAGIMTGSVVIEQIFGIPGIGTHFVKGALNRDYTLVMGVVILYGSLIILFNLLVDIAYAILDPKVRLH